MRISGGKQPFLVWMALAVSLLLLALLPGRGGAQTAEELCNAATDPSVATDSDADGIPDYYECTGFHAAGFDGLGSGALFTGYLSRGAASRGAYLDPTGKDVFFALSGVVAGGLLETAIATSAGVLNYYSQGLGITVHPVTAADLYGDRVVFYPGVGQPFQRAVMVAESTSTLVPDILGETYQGTPNGQDGSTIYTKNIQNVVNQYCPTTTVADSACTDASGAVGRTAVTNRYILQVVSHEVSHASGLAPEYSRKYGWHYAPQSVVMMEPSVKVVQLTSGKKVIGATFYIMTGYNPADSAATTISGGY